jgi:hypothetical protein
MARMSWPMLTALGLSTGLMAVVSVAAILAARHPAAWQA